MKNFFVALSFLFPVLGFANVSIENFAKVSEGIYRGALPGKRGMVELARFGIKTDLNLYDDTGAIEREARLAAALGIRHVSIPLSGFFRPSDEDIEKALAVLIDPANHPVFLHCKHGEDRTGMIVGLYRVFVEKVKPSAAYQEMKTLGFHSILAGLDCFFREKTGIRNKPLACRFF